MREKTRPFVRILCFALLLAGTPLLTQRADAEMTQVSIQETVDIKGIDGKSYTPESFEEDVVALFFGRTGCPNTVGMITVAEGMREKGCSVKIVLLCVDSVDAGQTAFAAAHPNVLVTETGYNELMFRLLHECEIIDGNSFYLPGTFLLDKSRTIVYASTGYDGEGLIKALGDMTAVPESGTSAAPGDSTASGNPTTPSTTPGSSTTSGTTGGSAASGGSATSGTTGNSGASGGSATSGTTGNSGASGDSAASGTSGDSAASGDASAPGTSTTPGTSVTPDSSAVPELGGSAAGAPDAVTQGADPQTEGKTAKPKTPKLTSVKRKAGTKAVIKWKKTAGADGYEIQMSTSKNKGFKKIKKGLAGKNSFTKKGLSRNKNYYFRIRSYRKVNGKYSYSAWSKVKKI